MDNIEQYEIRQYRLEDARALADIFYNTIHIINVRDYSWTQLEAWAPKSSLDLAGWQKKWLKVPPFVAITENNIVGFSEFEKNGHIDCFYCHHEWIGKGVGSSLIQTIENHARTLQISRIFC